VELIGFDVQLDEDDVLDGVSSAPAHGMGGQQHGGDDKAPRFEYYQRLLQREMDDSLRRVCRAAAPGCLPNQSSAGPPRPIPCPPLIFPLTKPMANASQLSIYAGIVHS